MKTVYEWIVEDVDIHGDIQDVNHYDRLEDALRHIGDTDPIFHHYELGLVRDTLCEWDGLIDRYWCYFEKNGELPSLMDDAGPCFKKVPEKYKREAKKMKEEVSKVLSRTQR